MILTSLGLSALRSIVSQFPFLVDPILIKILRVGLVLRNAPSPVCQVGTGCSQFLAKLIDWAL
jgi:hypothetical protein